MRRIAIDLTPILPGGSNGGAKIMTIELIREFINSRPDITFILLTSKKNHAELAILDAKNSKRVPVNLSTKNLIYRFFKHNFNLAKRLLFPFRLISSQLHLPQIQSKLANYFRRFIIRPTEPKGLLKSHAIDLLYCPFTAPFYELPHIPTVSTVYDLQFHYYPQFFSNMDCHDRAMNFNKACKVNRLVCISNYVRSTVLENSSLPPEKVKTIYIFANRLPHLIPQEVTESLQRLHLLSTQFLLYPANFWQHKNHEMLLTAFSLYRHSHPESTLKLVCTGSPDARMEALKKASHRMGLHHWVIFPGYLSEKDIAALMSSCYAVIYPSLFEGFGMPIVEGIASKKPILCSNQTCLPEIAGPAAYLFDPRKPSEIVNAIKKITEDTVFYNQLIEHGKSQLTKFGSVKEMAQQYLQVFQETINEKKAQIQGY